MAIDPTISLTTAKFRHDSPDWPSFSIAEIPDIARIKMSDWVYTGTSVNDWILTGSLIVIPNRTLAVCPVIVRNVLHGADWATTANITVTNATAGNLMRDAGSGNTYGTGSTYNPTLLAALASIEAMTPATVAADSEETWISLQNNTSIVHDPTNAGCIHGIEFRTGGVLTIRELGEIPVVNGLHQFVPGDGALIELTDGIVRYYKIKANRELVLLRTTRSKLTVAPKAECGFLNSNTYLESVLVMTAEGSTTLETVGVLENFQDWKNDFFISSNADVIQMANNEPQFTYPNQKRRLRSISANLAMRTTAQRLAFEDFFNYHGMEKEFIFVDKAKTDATGATTEWWARFASPFGDKSLQSCLSSHQATIVESYRNDYIPKLSYA